MKYKEIEMVQWKETQKKAVTEELKNTKDIRYLENKQPIE